MASQQGRWVLITDAQGTQYPVKVESAALMNWRISQGWCVDKTPLIAATPERREALEKLITRGKNHFMQGAWTAGHNFVAISEMEEPTEIVIMREMLAEMEEGNDDQP